MSVMAFSSNLKQEVLHPEGVSTAKMVTFHSGTIKLQMCENSIFLVSVKYSLIGRIPALAILGHCHVS